MKIFELANLMEEKLEDVLEVIDELSIEYKTEHSKLNQDQIKEVQDFFSFDPEAPKKVNVELDENPITVQELAKKLDKKLSEIMQITLKKGLLLNLNSHVDYQIAKDIATELNFRVTNSETASNEPSNEIKESLEKIEESELEENIDNLQKRAPVITIMGHVDHGKTTLLDTIRKSNVTNKEAGGITQHIGAYQVSFNDETLTFIDTPGHKAFTSLRLRGAQITDIVILVVAADDGIKPQTVEAIEHAKQANVPIIVAINKVDKPGIDIERCKQQLSEYELIPEEWGGKTPMVPLSAKTGKGLDDLLEIITITSDVLELKASHEGFSKSIIIESRLSRKKGPIASVIVKTGTLKVGDYFFTDNNTGKVRALIDSNGQNLKVATPSQPVEILGLNAVPKPGSLLQVRKTEKECKKELANKTQQIEQKSLTQASLEALSKQAIEGNEKTLNLIIKADVNGSLEAVIHAIKEIPSKDVNINIIHSATGLVSESDILLAQASQAFIFTFNSGAQPDAKNLIDTHKIKIKSYKVIYEIIDDIEKLIAGYFDTEYEEIYLGTAEVREIFKYSKTGIIAGCYVKSGKIIRNKIGKIIRDKKEIYTNKISSLKRFKDDVKEVNEKFECGISFDEFNDIKQDDLIECYDLVEKNVI